MIVKLTGIPLNTSYPPLRSNHPQIAPDTALTTIDKINISDAARSRQLADIDTHGQWENTLAMQRSGVPQLINMESAIDGGIDDMQNRLQKWLSEQGFDANTHFSLTYDAANRLYQVEGTPELKGALEAELNNAMPSPLAAAMREGYALLEAQSSGLDGVRKQFALDQVADGHDVMSRLEGFAYRFSLDWSAERLSVHLETKNTSVQGYPS